MQDAGDPARNEKDWPKLSWGRPSGNKRSKTTINVSWQALQRHESSNDPVMGEPLAGSGGVRRWGARQSLPGWAPWAETCGLGRRRRRWDEAGVQTLERECRGVWGQPGQRPAGGAGSSIAPLHLGCGYAGASSPLSTPSTPTLYTLYNRPLSTCTGFCWNTIEGLRRESSPVMLASPCGLLCCSVFSVVPYGFSGNVRWSLTHVNWWQNRAAARERIWPVAVFEPMSCLHLS